MTNCEKKCEHCKGKGKIEVEQKYCAFCPKMLDYDEHCQDFKAYGILRAAFGYGSGHDSLVLGVKYYHICDNCYKEKILDNLVIR